MGFLFVGSGYHSGLTSLSLLQSPFSTFLIMGVGIAIALIVWRLLNG